MINRLFLSLFCLLIAHNLSANEHTDVHKQTNHSNQTIQTPSPEHISLSQNQAKWQNTGMLGYRYEYIRQCIDCGQSSAYQVMDILIEDGQVVQASNKRRNHSSSTDPQTQSGWTINDWFTLINDYLNDQDKRFLQVEYNPLSGQPLKLKVLDGAGKTVIHLLKPAIPVKVDLS